MSTHDSTEERLAVFLDFENVAIGSRDLGFQFEMAPLLDALADRGRIVVKRAYADWNLFRDHRRGLVDSNVELIEIPQRSDSVRKNAADIKMAVDAMELALGRDFIGTYVIVSGDSDFTPLVNKLRELDRRVIGVGLRGSTANILPPSCDEFIFYDRLESVQTKKQAERRDTSKGGPGASPKSKGSSKRSSAKGGSAEAKSKEDLSTLARTVTRTLSGLQRSQSGSVLGSNLKRALLRKDPTFDEADYGFRAFTELLRHLESEGHISLNEGSAPGDPEVDFPKKGKKEEEAFELLRDTVAHLMKELGGDPPLSGLKDLLRKRDDGFSEKEFGFSGFLQFCKAASARDYVNMDWEEEDQEYYLWVPEADAKSD
ncbi:MAG TPA: NYN domain-containing protein [Nitriliruptorales bacterium]